MSIPIYKSSSIFEFDGEVLDLVVHQCFFVDHRSNLAFKLVYRSVTLVFVGSEDIKIQNDLFNVSGDFVSVFYHVVNRHHGSSKIDMFATFRNNHNIFLSFEILQLLQYSNFLFFTLFEFLL